ncbi:MAG: hypothetical protein IPP64_04940 [Bacteroidetes bacterium]|nr:hypothetical protein [Bacteroidota bacterium]
MEKRIKILGIIALSLGIISALLCVMPYGLFLSLPTGFLGMLTSTTYVYFDTKYGISKKKLSLGVIGILLSSIPIILVLAIIIMSKR